MSGTKDTLPDPISCYIDKVGLTLLQINNSFLLKDN